jgi:hypothetical protein
MVSALKLERKTLKDLVGVYFPKIIQMMDMGSRDWMYADKELTGETGTWARM